MEEGKEKKARMNGFSYTGRVIQRKATAIYLLAMVMFSMPVRGQYYNLTFRNFLSHTGIAQSEVDAIFEDSRGFLWIGTHFGLTRYDGREFRSYYHHVDDTLGIGDNEISDIDEDADGLLWMSLFNTGFCSYDTRTAKFRNFKLVGPGALPSDKAEAILVDSKNRIVLGTDSGLSVYDPGRNIYTNIPSLGNSGKFADIIGLEKDNDGGIWVCTRNDGLWLLTQDFKVQRQLVRFEEAGAVRDVLPRKDGGAWVAGGEGLFEIQAGEAGGKRLSRAVFFPQRESFVDIALDNNGNLWLATEFNGLFIYFPSTGFIDHVRENFSSARGLLSNRMFELFIDSMDGIWLGGENGLQYFHHGSQKFNIYPGLSNISDVLRGSTLYGIEEVDNDLMMASSGGMVVYNRVSNKYISVQYPSWYMPGSIRFRSLSKEAAGRWWVSTDRGIFEIRKKGQGYVLARPAELKGHALFQEKSFRKYLRRGKDYWFALAEEGLLHWSQATGALKFFKHDPSDINSLPSDVINQMEFDRKGDIMIGHNKGMSVFQTAAGRFTHFRERDSVGAPGLNTRYVYDMHDDGQYYWLATFGGGLNRVDKQTGSVRFFTTREGLCNDGIYTMVCEHDSVLWMGTAKGLARFKMTSLTFENFRLDDGLPADEFNMLSRYTSKEGEIFMGTMNGLISFHGADIRKSNIAPRIYLSRIRLNGVYLGDSTVSGINTKKEMITRFGEGAYLEFSSMVFNGNGDLLVRYRFSETDTGWKAGERGALVPLVGTEPGEYTLRVQIYRSQGEEKSPEWTMKYVVTPPYWRTIPFRLAVVLASLLAVFLSIRAYIRFRLRSQRAAFEREKAVEQERSRISSELHDDIGGGLTAIRLMSEMVKESSQDEKNKVYIGKISASSNELVQKMNEIVWALNLNHDNLQSLVSYTREFAVSYLDDFGIDAIVRIPEHIPGIPVAGSNRRDVFLLIKETLNNIVKHAHAKHVWIEFRIGDALCMVIRDDGRGFNPGRVRNGANGLVNMQKRVKKLKGKMEIRQDGGTVVQFDIPIANLTVPPGA
jgi:signal transduction histidine kinase/ligand-binding sensor domain-containing protein